MSVMYPHKDSEGNKYRILEDGSIEYENVEVKKEKKDTTKSPDDGSGVNGLTAIPREEQESLKASMGMEGYHPYDLSEAFKGYGYSKPKIDRTIDDDQYFDENLVYRHPTDEQGNPQKSLIDILSGFDATDAYDDFITEDGTSAGFPDELPSMTDNKEDSNKFTRTDRRERAKEMYDLYITEGDTSPANKSDLEDFIMEFPGKAKDIASKGWEGIKGIASGIGQAVSDYTSPSKVDIYDFDPYHAERYYMALLQIDPAMAEGYKDMYTKRKELEKDYAKIDATLNKDSTIDDIRATHNTYLRSYTDIVNKYGKDDPRALELKKQLDYTAKLLAEKGLLDNSNTTNAPGSIPPPEGSIVQKATKEARDAMDTAIDKNPNDGIIDNLKSIERTINDIANSNPGLISTDPWKSVLNELESLKSKFDAEYSKKMEKNKQASEESRQSFSAYKDYVPAINAANDLASNPNDETAKQMGASQLLKILSGSGVSDSERSNTILALTSSEFQAKYRSDTKGLSNALIRKYFVDNSQMILNDIIKNADGNKIRKQLENGIPSQAKEWYKRTQKTEKPAADLSKVDKTKYPKVDDKGNPYRVENGIRKYYPN